MKEILEESSTIHQDFIRTTADDHNRINKASSDHASEDRGDEQTTDSKKLLNCEVPTRVPMPMAIYKKS